MISELTEACIEHAFTCKSNHFAINEWFKSESIKYIITSLKNPTGLKAISSSFLTSFKKMRMLQQLLFVTLEPFR